MRGDDRVIELLNEVLTNELTAVNQYYVHSAMQKNWGYTRLAEHTYAESVDEMKHADLGIELGAMQTLRRGIALCLEVPDQVTRLLLEEILKSEEEHVDYLETQLGLVESLGLQEFLALQVGG